MPGVDHRDRGRRSYETADNCYEDSIVIELTSIYPVISFLALV
jgi:hypothetical protein